MAVFYTHSSEWVLSCFVLTFPFQKLNANLLFIPYLRTKTLHTLSNAGSWREMSHVTTHVYNWIYKYSHMIGLIWRKQEGVWGHLPLHLECDGDRITPCICQTYRTVHEKGWGLLHVNFLKYILWLQWLTGVRLLMLKSCYCNHLPFHRSPPLRCH